MTILACDLGGTLWKIGIVRDGNVLAKSVELANSKATLRSQLHRLKEGWQKLLASLHLEVSDCEGISMAFPSFIEPGSGRVLGEFGKFADAPELDLRLWAKEEMGLPFSIENDARMALIGEWKYGAGLGSEDIVMITLGTGIGTAALVEGRVLRGKNNQAGVLAGHMTVRYGGRKCNCGNVGCAEAEASTAFLADIISTQTDFISSALAQESVLDFAAVFKHAKNGDPYALSLRDHSTQVWAALAVNLIHAYAPERIIIGGGIMASAEVILPAMERYIHCHATTPMRKVQVIASKLGDEAALLAGDWLLREQLQKI